MNQYMSRELYGIVAMVPDLVAVLLLLGPQMSCRACIPLHADRLVNNTAQGVHCGVLGTDPCEGCTCYLADAPFL